MSPIELPESVTSRAAVVYVRQSTLGQVQENLESQRRQYGLAHLARSYGLSEVHVIDGDLGRSGSGLAERPGFERLVTLVCTGSVGAVFSLEASRLARNGRDWHRLVDMCGIVGTRVIDADGVYDPRRPNDRLLLGLKGTMSEFELTLLRSRLTEAQTAKARRTSAQDSPILPAGTATNAQLRHGIDKRYSFMQFSHIHGVSRSRASAQQRSQQNPPRAWPPPPLIHPTNPTHY